MGTPDSPRTELTREVEKETTEGQQAILVC